ncbi:hypothetical protein ACJ6WD_35580 [Streptomyces sp. VTCC 41912]|uniref:DUF6197 family protein n=1 Tax=Streptomyces sp. VTCC 41912 TaxID=3383243 RepID=UPI003896B749
MKELVSPRVELIIQSAALASQPTFWWGPSGGRVTGEEVAAHLEAAADLMEQRGWDPQLYAPWSGYNLPDALRETIHDGLGSDDTRFTALRLMETLLGVYTGSPSIVFPDVWSMHSRRTLDEVLEMLRTTADLARLVGPRL